MSGFNVRDVVFDTSPVRELAYGEETPAWATIFADMRWQGGFRFSLTDHAAGELLGQRARGSIGDAEFGVMIERLGMFLDPEQPVMLGGHDIFKTIGGEPPVDGLALSQNCWRRLRAQVIVREDVTDPILDEDRQVWIELFEKTKELYLAFRADAEREGRPFRLDELDHPILDAIFKSFPADARTDPPLSTRLDLLLRYFWRQFVRSQREHEPYNVYAPKKCNDGIDFGLYTYLAVPAVAVATERGFHKAIGNIPSFQRPWIYRPSDLAEQWSSGSLVLPSWPVSKGKTGEASPA